MQLLDDGQKMFKRDDVLQQSMELFHPHPEKVLKELVEEIEAFQKQIFQPHNISISRDETVMGKKYYLTELMNKYLAFLLKTFRKARRELPALVRDVKGETPLFTRETLAAEQHYWMEEKPFIDATRNVQELNRRATEIVERIRNDLRAMNDRLNEYKARVGKQVSREAV